MPKYPIKLRTLGDYTGAATSRFWQTITAITGYCRLHVRPLSNLEDVTELAWNRMEGEAHEKRAQAIKNYAEGEAQNVLNLLATQTYHDKIRAERAIADRLTSEANISQAHEMMARIDLLQRFRSLNVIPVWNELGEVTLLQPSESLDWNQFAASLGLPLPGQIRLELPESAASPEVPKPQQSHDDK